MAEGDGLLNRYTGSNPYLGFESLSLRFRFPPANPTNIATRKHGYAPTLLAMAGTRVHNAIPRPYSEAAARASDLHIERGHELMEYFLRGGNR